jgi:murein DD-endopeptidase MepM/ murein hydrolase activator NlpD
MNKPFRAHDFQPYKPEIIIHQQSGSFILSVISTIALLILAIYSLKTACFGLTFPIDETDREYKKGKIVLTSWYYLHRNDLPNNEIYKAICIPTHKGAKIKAITSGQVAGVFYDPIIGMVLKVSTEAGSVEYCHLKSIAISSGVIKEGEVIAEAGRSGRTTGYHLRLQAFDKNGEPVCITNDFGVRFYLQTGEVTGVQRL